MRCALASLYIFKRNVINAFTSAERMAKVAQHLHATRPNVYLACADSQRSHESMRIFQSNVARGETEHRKAEDALTRKSQPVYRFRGDNERIRGIKPTRHADDDVFQSGA